MIKIVYLADHLEAIPTLVQWFRAQWPEYFAGRTLEDIAMDFRHEANRDGLPVRLLAYADGELAGTVTFREYAMSELPEYRPGLGGLYVLSQCRKRGIGGELIRAGTNLARKQGFERTYAITFAAKGIMERQGWKQVGEVQEDGDILALMCCEIKQC